MQRRPWQQTGIAKMASGTAIKLGAAEGRLLARMPLHAVTSVHGEAGLRERLLMQTAQFPAADRAPAGDALAGIAAARPGPAAAGAVCRPSAQDYDRELGADQAIRKAVPRSDPGAGSGSLRTFPPSCFRSCPAEAASARKPN
jgi:hypothetical protein